MIIDVICDESIGKKAIDILKIDYPVLNKSTIKTFVEAFDCLRNYYKVEDWLNILKLANISYLFYSVDSEGDFSVITPEFNFKSNEDPTNFRDFSNVYIFLTDAQEMYDIFIKEESE